MNEVDFIGEILLPCHAIRRMQNSREMERRAAIVPAKLTATVSHITYYFPAYLNKSNCPAAVGSQQSATSQSKPRRRKASSAAISSPSLIPPNYQRVSKQSDTTDLLLESRGHDWKALPAYYDRSAMVMEGKSAPWW